METVTEISPLNKRTSGEGLLCYVIVFILLSFGAMTLQRNDIWRLELSLWYHVTVNSPEKVRPYVALGVAYSELGIADEGIKNLEKAVRAEPRAFRYRMNLGVAYKLAGRIDEAIVEFQRSLKDSDYYMTHYNLANILEGKGDIDGAIRHLEAAIILEANYLPAYNNLGLLYRKQGRTKDALSIYRRALEHEDLMTMRYNLARIYMEDELWNEAIIEFNEILKRDPNDEMVKAELTRATTAIRAVVTAKE